MLAALGEAALNGAIILCGMGLLNWLLGPPEPRGGYEAGPAPRDEKGDIIPPPIPPGFRRP